MRAFEEHNPIAVTVWFLCVLLPVTFGADPILAGISLVCAFAFFVPYGKASAHIFPLAVFGVTFLASVLLGKSGETVLFVVNDSPFTLEACLYALTTALTLAAAAYWFRSFTRVMTSDRLLCVFGAVSPKAALLLSAVLRYVPLFSEQAARIRDTQRALGLFRDGNVIDRVRSESRVFSVMTTWTLENGIITADSMAARGYGTVPRRTHFTLWRFAASDIALTLASVLLCASVLILGNEPFVFYPVLRVPSVTPAYAAALVLYAALGACPTIFDICERIRWKCLLSKI